jgi:hypothetical protein
MSQPEEKKIKSKKMVETKTDILEIRDWVAQLYKVDSFSDEDILTMYELVRYKGFDRNVMLAQMKDKVGDIRIATQLVILCALQGPVRASKTKLINGKTPIEMGIPASGQQGTTNLSCQRITAATADLAAFYLKKINVGKRIDSPLPGWLQFPSAGSIKLPDDLRQQHVDFSKKFSTLIGGNFNEQIYMQMAHNSYLEPSLHLF